MRIYTNETLRKQAAGIFLAAATYIRQYRWQRTGMSIHGRPRCSMGALASANPEPIWDEELGVLMYTRLYTKLGGMTLTQFNKQARDGSDVALLFEQVAQSLLP